MVHSKQRKVDKKINIQKEIVNDFFFKPKLKKINWRQLSGLNVDDIVSNVLAIN
jgi:hypothetical protein